ncbi:MAG: phospholipase D-like domain-containing protein [Candidatus Cyclonatronum sp.]|uniref:helicase-related protein n=1 Tax=Cyclonatronum sp. TaxID=3024185 RepID=UPI0025C034F5|nr:helicase-related protein [Cyclonatronum sp.]MCH8486899.1 phospholipase D-like domain-containing protein [Cyclonatronum sp.]
MSTRFFTNTEDKTVFQKFKGILEHMQGVYAFHAVVGYFRSSGYFALQPYLSKIKDIRILVGINVDQMFADAQRKGLLYFGNEEKTKAEFMKWFIRDLKEAKYSQEVEEGILQFIKDLTDGRIEVRAHNSKAIHAKFYIFLPENHSEHTDGWVIMGSSNLTEAGLGIKKSPNYELNIALKDYDDVSFSKTEFQKLWEQSTSILPADIQEFKKKTHIGQSFTPFEIYLKLLIEYFGKNIDYDPDTVGDLPKSYKKLSYQVDAVNQGFQMLMEHNGFFLADVVGLGKTVVASMIAKRFLIANGSLNTKILVVYPPALEKNWKNTFRLFGIDRHTKFITNGRLEKILIGDDLNYWPKEEYDLILVDEAHKYRNHTSQSFGFLQRICKAPRSGEGLVKGKNKKVILISATPLNNRPQDLYYQLLLFQDARRSSLPVTNLQSFFGPIIREYRELMRDEEPNISRIRGLYNVIREKVIAQITVRRTRRDLRNYPKYVDDLTEQGILFPEIAPLKAVQYDFDAKLSKLFYHTVFYLTDEDKVGYNRYQAIRYLKEELQEAYYDQAVLVSKALAGIMKTLMIKRLESSFHAFKITLNNLLVSTRRMIEMFENDRVLIAPDLNINQLIEKGFTIEEIEELILELSVENPKNNIFRADDFEPVFFQSLQKDEALLSELYGEWMKVKQDPKLDQLFKSLDDELLGPDRNPTGQLVIFTESNDTAEYLAEKISARTRKGVLKISSENRKQVFETIQANFDANYIGKRKDDYQFLITTDVLAEGINLHRANVMVNYDTPWNATRLMQRLGRINRIGSVAGVVYNYIFYPSQHGDEEIRLYKNALIKLQGFHTAYGEDAKVFTHEELVEQFELFKEGMPDEEDKRLLYLRFIREFKDANPREFKRIKNFPLKARTARKNANAQKPDSVNASLIFLKSQYKMEFYRVSRDNEVSALTFLEAAEQFEALATEPGYELPPVHFENVQAALDEFDKDFLGAVTETVTTTDKADAISAQAKKFLRDFKSVSRKADTKKACAALITLIDKGTFTPLPNEIRKLKRQLDKRAITYGQADNLIVALAQKYDAPDPEDTDGSFQLETDLNVTPEIVITETFIE